MKQEDIMQLTRIYNTLLTVHTCGEDTLVMADCMRAFQQILIDTSKKAESEENTVEE
jgi:hypothetical protein